MVNGRGRAVWAKYQITGGVKQWGSSCKWYICENYCLTMGHVIGANLSVSLYNSDVYMKDYCMGQIIGA